MKRFSKRFIAVLLFVIDGFTAASGQATKDVLTYHNDIYRTGVYAGETTLRPTNVNPKSFGKVFARRVLGQIWGQPLYVRAVPVNGQLRNVVFVATSENMVYGFDADDWTPDEQTPPLMKAHLGAPDTISGPMNDFSTVRPSNGISSTPVIDLGNLRDLSKGTLYVVAKLKQDSKFHLFALDVPTLAIRPNEQGQFTGVIVGGSAPGPGNTTVTFESSQHMNRPALLISRNYLIVAFGSSPPNNDNDPKYHGWVMSYSLPDLVQSGVFLTTPTSDTGMGAVWQAGSGPAADDQGNIYFMTGNGHFQETTGRQPDLADSFVKLANRDGALRLVDWYAPPSRDVLEVCDLDLGASGPVVIQDSGKVLGAGKSGIIYVLDKENMGKTDTALTKAERENWRGAPDCKIANVKCFRVAENQYQYQSGMKESKQACDMSRFGHYDPPGFNDDDQWKHVVMSYPHVHGSPVVWRFRDRSYGLYIWPEGDFLKAYHFDGQNFSTSPVGSSAPVGAAFMSMPGGILSLSWDGTNTSTGVIWASRPNPNTKHMLGSPFVSVFHDQQHFVSRDRHGAIWHFIYVRDQNEWRFHEIPTNGHPAAGDIFVSVFDSADQQHFVYTDSAGKIWDSSYRRNDGSWHFLQIDTHGHTPVGGIFVSAFFDQQHFVFRDGTGRIWDRFYAQADDKWHFNQIDTHGHPAAGNLFVSVFDFAAQQHFVYTDSAGKIWDSSYRRNDGSWHFLQIDTHGHTPVGGIFVSAFFDQQHFVFRDGTGRIWDRFYAQADDKWHFQQINGCMFAHDDPPHDLSPDDAPCNAINKIVHGYLQAFDATPRPNGELTELWNSEDNSNDRVEWFAKESPPTIADGKVFVAEFPAKPEKNYWNAPNAFGRLIMYSLLR